MATEMEKELMPAAEPAPQPSPKPELATPEGVRITTDNTAGVTTANASPELMPAQTMAPAQGTMPQAMAAGPQVPGGTAPQSGTGVPTTPVTTQVSDLETTRGQLRELLEEGSPYLEAARGRATRYAAGRGLQNSLMAARTGELAATEAALPIASSDAAANERRALANMDAENTFRLAEQGNVHALMQLAKQGDIQAQLALQQHGFDLAQIQASGDVQSTLQAERHAQSLIELSAQGDIQSQLMMQKFGFDSQLSAQENVQRLQQIAAQGDIDAQARLQAFNYQTMLLDQQQGHALQLEDARLQSQMTMLAQQYQNSLGLNQQDTQLWIQRQNVAHNNTLAQIQAQAEANASANQAVDAQRMTQQLQSQYLANVSQRQVMASQEIATIYQTQGLTAAQQTNAVRQAQQRMEADISALQTYYSQSPLWDPSWGGMATTPTGTTPTAPTSPTSQPPGTQPPTPPAPYTPSPTGGVTPTGTQSWMTDYANLLGVYG